ncbi:hypothetical protein EHO60_14445 [Leptospira fletcheri]|uniref:Serine protease n=1 Tax=Leptospira fletcheri TaxID=2484981 RepID=A0A4R9GAV1_9LEPT|nr:trypsin-like peptidase domain-containing protein [Leptospira fletcheri]TGK08773.1 hypothetical protein EHO60_14445 [Leptospira fletcheri]
MGDAEKLRPFLKEARRLLEEKRDEIISVGFGIGTVSNEKNGGYDGTGLGILLIVPDFAEIDDFPEKISVQIKGELKSAPTILWQMAPPGTMIPNNKPPDPVRKQKQDPLVGGISISGGTGPWYNRQNPSAGTLGMVVKQGAKKVLLTNAHVVRKWDRSETLNNRVFQPGLGDGLGHKESLWIGRQTKKYQNIYKEKTYIDAAIVSLREGDDKARRADLKTLVHNEPAVAAGTTKTKLFSPVQKSGRTTNVTNGIVRCIGLEWISNFRDDHTKSGIVITPKKSNQLFAEHGDSGSVVLSKNGTPVGLLWRGEYFKQPRSKKPDDLWQMVFASPIGLVCEALNIQFPMSEGLEDEDAKYVRIVRHQEKSRPF